MIIVTGMRTRWVLLAALLAGCESDAEKLERLKSEASIEALRVLRWERIAQGRAADDTTRTGPPEYWPDSLRAARNRSLLAERALRMFLDGR